MKRVWALGAALVAIVAVAEAQADRNTRVFIRHGGPAELAVDANEDGWVSRAEASAAAERMFAEMDENDDGRLNAEDRSPGVFEFHLEGPDIALEELEGEMGEDVRREVRREIVRAHREAERAIREAEVRVREAEREIRDAEAMAEDAERLAEDAERLAEDAERRGDRVIIVRNGDRIEWEGRPVMAVAPLPPMPPMPAMAPTALLLMFANSEEADRDGDGALSREEFRAQQLRFFDASDADGDGRVRFSFDMPAPPAPPEPPQPAPAPPARR